MKDVSSVSGRLVATTCVCSIDRREQKRGGKKTNKEGVEIKRGKDGFRRKKRAGTYPYFGSWP